MKKLTIILFAAAGIAVIFFAVQRQWLASNTKDAVRTKTVIPAVQGGNPTFLQDDSLPGDDITLTSLIPLQTGETLIASYSADLDLDGYDDQVIAVKTPDSAFIKLAAGLYNPLVNRYERAAEITTDIEQAKTFSLSVMDITGTHENTIIVTGYGTENESRFQAWLPRKSLQNFSLHEIVNLYAEGTVFVQQRPRSDSYPMEDVDGESFPIWAYTSDDESQEGSLDQLQIMYDWNKREQKYTEKARTRISQKSITAQELARIQDGTESTFAAFLNGLWTKAGTTAEQNRYLFCDYDKKEVIFFQNDRQEIYAWERSTLRRNGILVYTTNQSMPNISRRFDIALVSSDEIRIKVVDDLGMLIGSETLWDGNYKKQNSETLFAGTAKKEEALPDMTAVLQTTSRTFWKCDNGWNITFSGSAYSAKNGVLTETGVFSPLTIFGENLLQFKSRQNGGAFSGFYRTEITAGPVTDAETGRSANGTRVVLHPVTVSLSQIEPAAVKNLQFELETVQD